MSRTFKVGDRVWWSDPDDDFNSGPGKIMALQHEPPESDSVIEVARDDGGYIECLRCELRHYRVRARRGK
jgi:hypothetical protein